MKGSICKVSKQAERSNCFELVDTKNGKTFYICAEDKQSMVEWIDAISGAMEELKEARVRDSLSLEENIREEFSLADISEKQFAFPEESECILEEFTRKEDPMTVYSGLEKIGEGHSANVFSAFGKEDKRVAIKVMLRRPESEKLIKSEIHVMQCCVHENILVLLESYIVSDQVWMVLEYMDGGCLTDILDEFENISHNITENIIAKICASTLKALEYLHERHIIHRDVKSDNILLSQRGEIKLTDFGYAAQLTRKFQKRRTVVGTPVNQKKIKSLFL